MKWDQRRDFLRPCRDRSFPEHVYVKRFRSSRLPAATSRTTAELDNENIDVGMMCILKS